MTTGVFRLKSGEESRCEDVRLAMGEVLDGVADLTVKLAVESHVRACPPCATEMNELRAVVEGVKALSEVPPKPEAWPPVEKAIGGAPPSPANPNETSVWDRFRKFFGK